MARHFGKAHRALALLAALGLPAMAQAQTVVFPRNVTFKDKDPGGFFLGGNAFLTATGSSATGNATTGASIVTGTAIDANGSGTLRLTNATSDPQQAGYAIDNSTFDTPNGFSISFEFFAYGTNSATPADGFTVFLVDGVDTTPGSGFKIGGFGGSLGYAPRTQGATVEPGVTKGYLGIGIDEYGNYGIPSEGKTGGYPGQAADALLKNAVSLRGPFDKTDPVARAKGYAYLAGSNSLPFNLAVGTANTNATTKGSRITDPTNAGYRKAYINVIPFTENGKIIYKITVRIQNGQNVATAVNNFTVVDPPQTLRVGFGASTGGSNSIHEIRGLAIVQAPIAIDDNAQTRYGQSVVIGILNNDLNGGGAAIDPATVDLDPSTISSVNTTNGTKTVVRDASYTVPGKGTFTVDNNGVVTFAALSTFSGTVSIPYTVLNLNQNLSNLGNINVIVTGADVQTVVSGPTAVNPGTMTSYTVTTTNNGQETATNVRPTLTLPAGFTVFGTLPAGATSAVAGGVTTITFGPTTLTAQQGVTNSVQVTAPTATGSYALTSNYTYPTGAVVPDAVITNNTSTLNVTVQGAANIASVCAVPGKDGPMTLDQNSQPNTYYTGVTATSGSQTITVGTTPTGNTATPIAKGDMLLIIQMQGATITTTNDNTYGTVTGTPTAGKYEYAVAASTVSNTGSLTLAGKLANAYTANTSGNTFQVIRIPQYSTLTVSGTVTGPAWNGATGGVLALEVVGATSFNANSSLNMDGKGFRGGVATTNTQTTGASTSNFVSATGGSYALKGEGIAGTPINFNATNSYNTYAGGSYSRGNAATAGGGGIRSNVRTFFGGGGGGANGGDGGVAQYGGTGMNGTGGQNGNAAPSTSQLYLGGGGGAGATSETSPLLSSGGAGGGIIVLRSGSITNAATISANGTSASNNTSTTKRYSGGGGGAGGTLFVNAANGLTNITATVNGGNGGTSQSDGDGGGGGGGAVISNGAFGSATRDGGTSTNGIDGINGDNARIQNAPLRTDCTPALATALRTTTPNVTRSTNMSASYVYTVSNTGGGITGLTASPALATNGTNLFKYASMSSVVVRLADGTSQTLATTDYTVTNTGTSTPKFTLASGYVVPSGASVAFTFVASVDNAAVTGTAYGSNAAGTYLDPQRTTTTGTTATPAYTSGTGTADVVTIVAPLPVQLTKFTAVAVGADAVLSWTTAQEVNNHHFEVERSLDGHVFESVGTVAGHGTTTLTSGYGFTDAGASIHTTGLLYYRLRQVDYDGQASFSPVQTVRFRYTAGASNVGLYPNPATSSTTLDLSALPAGDYTVQVLETTGRLVRSGTYQPGQHALPLDGLATGTYFVKVQGASFNLVLPLSKQ